MQRQVVSIICLYTLVTLRNSGPSQHTLSFLIVCRIVSMSVWNCDRITAIRFPGFSQSLKESEDIECPGDVGVLCIVSWKWVPAYCRVKTGALYILNYMKPESRKMHMGSVYVYDMYLVFWNEFGLFAQVSTKSRNLRRAGLPVSAPGGLSWRIGGGWQMRSFFVYLLQYVLFVWCSLCAVALVTHEEVKGRDRWVHCWVRSYSTMLRSTVDCGEVHSKKTLARATVLAQAHHEICCTGKFGSHSDLSVHVDSDSC